MATCNSNQSQAIQRVIDSMKGKAYILIFDILDQNEDTAFYQVHYNDKTRVAMDFKQWTISKIEYEVVIARASVKEFVETILDQLMQELGEAEVVVRRVNVEEDGSVE
jgi:hypothetical protein